MFLLFSIGAALDILVVALTFRLILAALVITFVSDRHHNHLTDYCTFIQRLLLQ